jgi:hypothetical protein
MLHQTGNDTRVLSYISVAYGSFRGVSELRFVPVQIETAAEAHFVRLLEPRRITRNHEQTNEMNSTEPPSIPNSGAT